TAAEAKDDTVGLHPPAEDQTRGTFPGLHAHRLLYLRAPLEVVDCFHFRLDAGGALARPSSDSVARQRAQLVPRVAAPKSHFIESPDLNVTMPRFDARTHEDAQGGVHSHHPGWH